MEQEPLGVPASDLPEDDLFRELSELYRTRFDALRHGSDQALATHTQRMMELENDYLRRYPKRDIDPARMREGARERD
jgi:hypothetical protein